MLRTPAHHRPRSITRHRHGTAPTDDVLHGWVHAEDRVLSVAVHRPTGPERNGTVVIAGSPGRERVTMFRTIVDVARTLAADGWRVVRFDWAGTGLSPWTTEAAPAENWADDLEVVREWAAQAGPVHGLGMRLGGSILAAFDEHGWASRHVWAPVSGKLWLRHQVALRRMAGPELPARVTPGVELMDLQLGPEGANALKQLPEPEADSGRGLDILDAPQLEPVPVDVHPRVASVPPEAAATIAGAVAAVADRLPGSPAPGAVSLIPNHAVRLSVDGTVVHLRRTRVGRDHRPAVITIPDDLQPAAPGVAFVSLGSEPMEAPGSLWTRAAITASARGAVCLLAERTDTGELVRPGRAQDPNPYVRYTLTESREVLEELARLTDGPLKAAGVCLGAWGLVACVHQLPKHVTQRLSLYAVNNIGWQRAPWRYWRQGLRSGPLAPAIPGQAPAEPSGSDPAATPSLEQRLGAVARTIVRGARRAASNAHPRVSAAAAAVGIIDVPHPLMRRLARIPGLRVDVIFGPADAQHAGVTAGPISTNHTVTVLDPLDHSLHATASRRSMLDHLLADL
ncbi:hypothetical protein [Kocuria sp. cx-455]|uniref:hypothetical protein n=1 Tax=Kocuria sp. cx-455 TaxID=2771377 RepID=UPI003D74DA10